MLKDHLDETTISNKQLCPTITGSDLNEWLCVMEVIFNSVCGLC